MTAAVLRLLRDHWLVVALVLAVCVLLYGNSRQQSENREAWQQVAVANERAARWQATAAERSAEADSLKAVTKARVDTAEVYITRWRTRVDSIGVPLGVVDTTGMLALADSTIRACTLALGSCQQTVTALESVVEAQDSALLNLTEARDALARSLERLEGGDPIWTTPALIGIGAGAGYAADGVQGALVGAGIGLATDIAWRGVKSLVRSIP